MKHLFVFLSLLFLSSPVIGQEIGVLFRYETPSGFAWKSVGSEKLQPKYNGEIKNSNPNGFGFITYPNDEISIIGEWKDGKEWNTKHTKTDGKLLLGKFEYGKWIVSWGVLYWGYRDGKIGNYNEKWEGLESEENKDYSKYEGEIKNGFPNGHGTDTLPDGQKYVGEFKDGQYHGQGAETLPNGQKYVGEFKDGQYHGQGTDTLTDGTKYVGEFKDGQRNGQGTYTWPDGRKYEGKFEDGQRNGQGSMLFPNGRLFVGGWKGNIPNGQGTEIYPDGGKYVGEYKGGLPWNGKKYYANGKINYLVMSGKVIKK